MIVLSCIRKFIIFFYFKKFCNASKKVIEDTVHRVIEMAWEDALNRCNKKQFSLSEKQIIMLMRTHLRPASLETGKKGCGKKDQDTRR